MRCELLKEFLGLFSQIVGNTQSQSIVDPDDEIVRQTVKKYPLLSEKERKEFLDIVRGFGDQGTELRLYFEFLCLHLYKDKRYADDILDCLISADMDVARRFNYMTVLDRELFVTGVMADYEKCLSLEKLLVGEIKKGAALFPEFQPYNERDHKTIVIIIRPFLGMYHSPSLRVINLDYYLRKLGYKTYYISYSENEILKKYACDVCAPFSRSVLYEGITRFAYNCSDMVINGLHFDLRQESMTDDLNALAVYISQMKPEFVIGIEGCNILADICTEFTDVICMNVVDDLPVTLSDYNLRYFDGGYKNRYLEADRYGKKIFDTPYVGKFRFYNDGEEEDINLPHDGFHICIMGNRLDEELGDEMLAIIRTLLHEVPKTDVVFIGDCPKTERRLSDIKDRCIFLGYVNRCEDTIAECSLFLNPPRKGGGGGGYMAIKRSVPVYTLGNCDVASSVGKEFVHDSYDDLIAFISRCIDDPVYYGQMRDLAKECFTKSHNFDSLENIRLFIDACTELIREHVS